jgi:tetratricopeptide (TPR) repeat protein
MHKSAASADSPRPPETSPSPVPHPRRPASSPARTAFATAALVLLVGCSGSVPEPYVPPELAQSSEVTRKFIGDLLAIAKAKPTDEKARVDYALGLYFNELSKAAHENFRHLEALMPKSPLPKHYRAHCQRRFGDLAEAAKLYDEVAAAFPEFAPAVHERGRLALERDDFAAAERDFKRASELAPLAFEPWLSLGDVAVRQGEFEQALKHLEKAATIAPKDKVVLYQTGLALRGLGRRDEAEKKLAAGSGSIPKKMSDPWSGREGEFSRSVSNLTTTAIHLVQTGRMKEGITLLERLAADNPEDLELLNNLACAYQDNKQSEKAISLLEKALAKSPERDSTLVNFASLYINLGDNAKAIEYADRALKSNPTFGPAFFNKGNAFARQGKSAEAIAQYREGIRHDPRNGKIRSAMATVLFAQSKFEDARREATRAVELEPDYLTGHLLLVEICAKMNDAAGAQAAFTTARKIAPNHPEVARIGQTYFRR